MSRPKLLRSSIGLANSFTSTRTFRLSHHELTQVTRFSHFTQFYPNFSPIKSYISNQKPFNFSQNLFFSSNPPQSFINLILSNNWSENIENELEKLNPNLTHESVLYILMNSNKNPQKSLDFFKWVCAQTGFKPCFSSYFILLRTLACKEFMNDFWDVFLEVKKRGFYIDFKAYSVINIKLTYDKLSNESAEWRKRYKEMIELDGEKAFFDEILRLILLFDWGEVVKGLLKRKIKFPVEENFVLRLIVELWEQPLKALGFFEWIGSCGGYKHDSVSYNAMARVLGQSECVSEFWGFVKRMRVKGYDLDIYTYMRCCKHLPVKDGVELYEFTMDGPYQPSLQHSTSLLTKVSSESDPDLGLVTRVFNKIVRAGYSPSKILFDGVHRALCSLGRFDEAEKVVEDMRSSGFTPDNFTYSDEVSGLCKYGRLDEACNVLDQMEVDGCVPNVKRWTMLIRGLCEAKRMSRALSCYAKMKRKNVNPDPETLSVMLNGFISDNKVLDGYKFFTELIKSEGKLKPYQGNYKLMIDKLSEVGKLEEALHVLSLMKKQHYRVFPQPITAYISECGTVEDAKRLLDVLSPNVTSAATVYGNVIKAFTEHGRYSEAEDLICSSPRHVREDKMICEMLDSMSAPPLETVS